MKNCITILCLVFVCNISFAQNNSLLKWTPGHEARHLKVLQSMYQPANPTAAQWKIIIQISTEIEKQSYELDRQGYNADPKDREALAIKKLDVEDQIMELFSEEQVEKYESYFKELKIVFKKNSDYLTAYHAANPHANKKRMAEMKRVLHEQRKKLEALMNEADCNERVQILADEQNYFENRKKQYDGLKYATGDLTYKEWRAADEKTRQAIKELRKTPEYKTAKLKYVNSPEFQQMERESELIELRKRYLEKKYNSEIAMLMNEIKPQRIKWFEHTNNLPIVKFKKDHNVPFMPFFLNTYYVDQYDEPFMYRRFLFQDVNDFENNESDEQSTVSHSTQIFPNPADRQQTLSFETKQKEHVIIELLDQQGKVIRTILSEPKTVGKHELKVELNDLADGIYFYQITSESGVSSTQFVKAER